MSTELIYGIHAVSALLERTPERFIEVWALKGRDDDRLQPLLAELESLGLKVQSVNRKTLDDKAEGNNHQGIMARVKRRRSWPSTIWPACWTSWRHNRASPSCWCWMA